MDVIHRVVDVWTGSSFGSGFLLTNRLVLTARHVVQSCKEIVIRPLVSGESLACQAIWMGRNTDTALLEILDALPADLQDVGPVDLGWSIATSRPLACSAIGFPWSQQRSDGKRDT